MPDMEPTKPTFRNAQEAFADAIRIGRLSDKPGTTNYAGHFMYMGTWPQSDGSTKDLFKHIDTRKYLP